jgi:hypothetical protein
MLRQITNLLGRSNVGPVAQQVAVWNCENTPQFVNSDTTLTQPRVPVRSSSNIVPRGALRGVGWCVWWVGGVFYTRPTPRRPAQGNFRPLAARLALAVQRETCQQIDPEALTAHDVVGYYSPRCREEVFSETQTVFGHKKAGAVRPRLFRVVRC